MSLCIIFVNCHSVGRSQQQNDDFLFLFLHENIRNENSFDISLEKKKHAGGIFSFISGPLKRFKSGLKCFVEMIFLRSTTGRFHTNLFVKKKNKTESDNRGTESKKRNV